MAPRDRREAGVPIPLPAVTPRARTRIREVNSIANANDPTSLKRFATSLLEHGHAPQLRKPANPESRRRAGQRAPSVFGSSARVSPTGVQTCSFRRHLPLDGRARTDGRRGSMDPTPYVCRGVLPSDASKPLPSPPPPGRLRREPAGRPRARCMQCSTSRAWSRASALSRSCARTQRCSGVRSPRLNPSATACAIITPSLV